MAIPDLPKTETESAQLSEVLSLFADILLTSQEYKIVQNRVAEYLDLDTLHYHIPLRKAVYELVFNRKLLSNSSVETYFAVVKTFGLLNVTKCQEFIAMSPRSIPLKLGRLLLYFAEFGSEIDQNKFRTLLSIWFSVRKIATCVFTDGFVKELHALKTFNKVELQIIIEQMDLYKLDKPLANLIQLFPQLKLSDLERCVLNTNLSLEMLTQRILDDPEFLNSKNTKKVDYVDIKVDKERREQSQRLEAKQYKYDFDSDPDPMEEDLPSGELSEADRKVLEQEQTLWTEFSSNPEVFEASARGTNSRKTLKNKIHFTDEQIEGWARVVASKNKNQTYIKREKKEKKDKEGEKEKKEKGKKDMKRDNYKQKKYIKAGRGSKRGE